MKIWRLILFICFIACSDPYAGQLTEAEKALVDSLYNKDIDSIRIYYDSLCAAQYDSLFKVAVDSILSERVREIEDLRNLR